MGSRQYIIPIDTVTITDMKNYRLKALAAGIMRAYDLKVCVPESGFPSNSLAAVISALESGKWPEGVDVREWQNIADAGTALDRWLTAALAAAGTAYSLFQAIAAPAIGLRATKIAVFYGVSVENAAMPISRLTFRRTGATGNIMYEYDTEPLIDLQNQVGYFSEPVVIDSNTPFAAQALCRIATGVAEAVKLLNFVFEPAGQSRQ
ncbi:MAG: hypothetical protein PHU23_01080 [Dehalococcoidales bacterium]|nr:hypothetical protein [Dehalococcoidales bacterium]